MTAAKTVLPVLGVPVESRALKGVDSLLSIVQMPAGVPVGTFAIGTPGRSMLHCLQPRSSEFDILNFARRFGVIAKLRRRPCWTTRIQGHWDDDRTVGGGQLGRMLALAGSALGLRFRAFDHNPDAPVRSVPS